MVCIVTGLAATAPTGLPAAVVPFAVAGAGAVEGASVGATIMAIGEGASFAVGATFLGPIGWAVVGCNKNDDHNGDSGYTWDCWKPIIRDTSTQPSRGMTLRCLAAQPNIRSMSFDEDGLLVKNTFGECFHLSPVSVEGTLAFHASILSS